MGEFGLIGQPLAHSFSPAIHQMLGNDAYRLFPLSPDALEDFLKTTSCDGLNVTIPYKQAVIPFCSRLTPSAAAIGSVNTLVRLEDGGWLGDNTDYDGFADLLGEDGAALSGEKALVLGSGGASKTVCAVLRDRGIRPVVISRRGADNYENLDHHADCALLVNATPVGMYPDNGSSPLDLRRLPHCQLVLDLIYNPAKTALLLQAQRLGIPARNGLPMLVCQAACASERFLKSPVEPSKRKAVLRAIAGKTRNIFLIGMPGCGKTTVARELGARTGRPVTDIDQRIVQATGMDIPAYFTKFGEPAFRTVETRILAEVCKESGQIVATGGGVVVRPENLDLLRQNGVVLFLDCDRDRLQNTEGRPVSQRDGVDALLRARMPLYTAWSDRTYYNADSKATACMIQEDYCL